jgi:glycosyltransferase EpsH
MLSIIVPVYNCEKYIGRCVDSIINSLYLDIELIIINDGSTDNTKLILDYYRKEDNRIKIINQKNKGISAARNLGLQKASGEYVTFLDADDWIEPDTYKKMLNKMIIEEADLIMCGVYNEFRNKTKKSLYFEDNIYYVRNDISKYFSEYFIDNGGVVWNKIYKRDIIVNNDISFINRKLVLQEDELFNINYFLNINKVVTISDFLIHYRVRKSSITKKKIDNIYEKKIEIIEYIDSCINDTKYEDFLHKYLCKKSYRLVKSSLNHYDKLSEIKRIFSTSMKKKYFSSYILGQNYKIIHKNIGEVINSLVNYLLSKNYYNLASLIQFIKIKLYKFLIEGDNKNFYE